MRQLALLFLAACQPALDLGDARTFDDLSFPAIASTGQAPPPISFTQDLLIPGEYVTFEVTGATPGDTVYFGRSSGGVGAGPCIGSINLCLDILGPVDLLGVKTADFLGEARLRLTLPYSLPAVDVFTQAVAVGPGGAVASNTLSTRIAALGEDLDGDGYCAGDRRCNDRSLTPGDCNDEDADVNPGQTGWFTEPMVRMDGVVDYDYDCDFFERPEIFDIYNCAIGLTGFCFDYEEAWVDFPAECGDFGTLGIGCLQTGLLCFPFTILPSQMACN